MDEENLLMPGAPMPPQSLGMPMQGMAQPQAMQQQPMQPFMNPAAQAIAMTGGMIPTGAAQQSVLAEDPRQQRLGQMWDQTLESQFANMRSGRGEQIATDIAGKLIGPAMAAFGGLGTGAGGLQLIQKADQDLANARLENRQKLSDTGTLLNQITNIVDRTSPNSLKAIAQQHKAEVDAARANEKAAADAAKEERLMKGLGMKADQFKMKQDFEKTKLASLDKYRNGKLGLDEKKMNQYATIQKARMKLQDEQFKIAKDMQEKGINAGHEIQLQRLQVEVAKFDAAEERLRANLNAQIQSKMAEQTNGKPKYPGLQLLPLEGVNVDMEASPEYMKTPELQQASQALQELEAEVPAQGQTQPGVQGQAQTSTPVQGKAWNIPGARARYDQIMHDPKAPPEMKQKAATDFAKFMQQAGATSGGRI